MNLDISSSCRLFLRIGAVFAGLVGSAAVALLSFAYPDAGAREELHPFLAGPPLSFAHRGDSMHYPENTMPAFASAMRAGVDVLELDVHSSADGVVVVHHDETLQRTAGQAVAIRSLSYAELSQIDIAAQLDPSALPAQKRAQFRGRGYRIPALTEVLRAFPESRINIEIKQKTPPMERQLFQVLVQEQALERSLVASGSGDSLRRFRALQEKGAATSASMSEVLRFYAGCRLGRTMRPPFDALQIPAKPTFGIDLGAADFIACAKRSRIQTHYWTVNDAAEARRLLAAGADGIMSDDAPMVAAVVREFSRP